MGCGTLETATFAGFFNLLPAPLLATVSCQPFTSFLRSLFSHPTLLPSNSSWPPDSGHSEPSSSVPPLTLSPFLSWVLSVLHLSYSLEPHFRSARRNGNRKRVIKKRWTNIHRSVFRVWNVKAKRTFENHLPSPSASLPSLMLKIRKGE